MPFMQRVCPAIISMHRLIHFSLMCFFILFHDITECEVVFLDT